MFPGADTVEAALKNRCLCGAKTLQDAVEEMEKLHEKGVV